MLCHTICGRIKKLGGGGEIWILIKEGRDGMVAKKAALRTGACLGL